MVFHQHEGMERDLVLCACLGKGIKKEVPVLGIKKDRLQIVTPVNNVVGQPSHCQARQPGHIDPRSSLTWVPWSRAPWLQW